MMNRLPLGTVVGISVVVTLALIGAFQVIRFTLHTLGVIQ